MALVEQELHSREAREFGLGLDARQHPAQLARAVGSFAAGQGDVRMVRARIALESAEGGGGRDAPLKGNQFRGRLDLGIEDAGAVKDAQAAETDGNGRAMDFGQPRGEQVALLVGRVAKELECDVP